MQGNIFLRHFHGDVGSRDNISPKNGNPSLRRKAGTRPSAEGKAGAERESSTADCRTMAEEYEWESREGTWQGQVMKDPFFRFCVETFLEATSVLVPRSGFAPGYRRPHQAKTSQVLQTEVWYRPRVGCSQVQAGTAVLRLKARLQLSLHCLHTHGQHLNHCPFAAQLFPISSKVEDRAAGRREAAQPKMHSPCHSTPTWAEGRSPPLCWTYGLLG